MSTVELGLAIDWLKSAIKAELEPDKSIRDFDYCVNRATEFIDNSVVVPIYTFSRATNQPYPHSKGYFVSCNKRDMQPHMCNTILADSFNDAYEWAFIDAIKWGESYALINGESFEF